MNEISLAMIRKSLNAAVLADALDSLGYRQQSPRIPLPALTGAERLVGRCKTTRWEDVYEADEKPYELELRAVDSCQPDDVVICAAAGSQRSALWGGLLSTAAQSAGCVGAIVDGAARDIGAMTAMRFPVFGAGTSVYDSLHRQRVVDFDQPVEIAGVRFQSGDLVIADLDGVVVVPQSVEQDAVQRAWDKVHAENHVRDAIRSGLSATEAYRQFGVL
jgi:regulator of RNase E activity RraA